MIWLEVHKNILGIKIIASNMKCVFSYTAFKASITVIVIFLKNSQ